MTVTARWCALWLLTLLNGCAIVNLSLLPSSKGLQERVIEGEGREKILLIDLSGTITGEEESGGFGFTASASPVVQVKEALQKAEEDGNIAGVILRVNSPGGSATASDIIYHELMDYKKHTGVPIYTSILDLGASGGYYVAAATDKIYAHPTAVVGSISVIAMTFNVEGLMSKVGIEEETFKSGDKKDIGSPFRPVTPEERAIFQSIVDALHGRFVDLVYENRKAVLSRSEVASLADGRIYTAGQALDAKLIDGIGYLDDVIGEMKSSLGISQARIVAYGRSGERKSTIYSKAIPETPRVVNLIGLNIGDLSRFEGVRFMYLWRP